MNIAKKTIIKLCAILIIIALTISDFLFVGTAAVSYAVDVVKTNSSNVNFSAYFINSNGEKVETLEENIDKGEEYIYVDVSVYNDGYFNGTIYFNNSNFNIKEDILSSNITEISGNEVKLSQINAGSTVTIKIAIEPKSEDTINKSALSTTTEVVLEGEYVNSKNVEKNKYTDITGTAKVEVNWISSESTNAELEASLLTNSTYEIDGEEKRVVQILVNSNITNNNYPVQDTQITMMVPTNVQDVMVHARSTSATNSNIDFSNENYTYNEQAGELTIQLSNTDTNNISWNKDVQDTIVITYVLNKEENINGQSITINSTITTYDDKELTASQDVHIEEEIDGIVSYEIETTEDYIYKGKLYTGEERNYTVINKINVDYLNVVENITLKGNSSTYLASEQEGTANIFYKETKINKEEFLELFGEDGYIKIIDADGVIIANITSNTEADENGNIVISYFENTKNIRITTSEPINIGTLNIEHTKTIQETNYTRNVIDILTDIKETINGNYNTKEESNQEKLVELKDVTSKASLEVSTDVLSTTETNEDVKMTVILLNNDESRDLYQNPVIKITLPEQVTSVTAKCRMLYANGLELSEAKIIQENGLYVIEVDLSGIQTIYNTESLEGTTIIIYADLELDKLSANSDEEIKMTYTNELATSFEDNGEQNVPITITANSGVITTNNIEEYGVETLGDEGTQTITLDIQSEEKNATVSIDVVNNEEAVIENVTILGKFPTGSDNEVGITLTSEINILSETQNINIYYSDLENPTIDLTDSSNGWSLEGNTNTTKSYLITIDKMAIGERFSASYSINIPRDLTYDLDAEESYVVNYTNTLNTTSKQTNSTVLCLSTGSGAEIISTLKAYVGEDEITDGDTVYTGEVIKYALTIENTGTESASNISIQAIVPENATCVQYVKSTDMEDTENGFIRAEDYYQEIETTNNILTKTYENLAAGEKKTIAYEVRINDEAANNTISSYSIINYTGSAGSSNATTSTTNTITNTVSQAELTMNIIMISRGNTVLRSGISYPYLLTVTNTSNNTLSNIEIGINVSSLYTIERVLDEDGNSMNCENNVFTISSLKAGETATYEIDVMLNGEGTVTISAVANDTYKSNKISETTSETNISITMSSNNEGEVVENGDSIIYNILITNESSYEVSYLELQNTISTYLDVERITINGEEVSFAKEFSADDNETTDNNDSTNTIEESDEYIIGYGWYDTLASGDSLSVVIYASSDSSFIHSNNVHIVSVAEVSTGSLTVSSGEINHILVANVATSADVEEEEDVIYSIDYEEQDENTTSNTNTTTNNNSSSEENSENSNNSTNSSTSETETYIISGIAWLDANEDGQRDSSESTMSGIGVTLLNLEDNTTTETTTTSNGFYSLTNVPNGKYILIFDYDTDMYVLTTYQADGVSNDKSSDVENVTISTNGTSTDISATDIIQIDESSVTNVNIGLIEAKIFDLSLEKTITKVSVTNTSGTTTTEYDDTTLAKVEVKAKYLSGTTVVIEYKVKVTNEGEIAGYVKEVIDYKPSDLTFNSSLNPDWYQSGEYIYSTSLANEKIEPGETKELTLILTKTMTESNTGLVNNVAEINTTYNSRGIADTDSTEGNKDTSEDDAGSANIIISVSTGAVVSYISITLTVIVLIAIGAFIISKKILKHNIKL